MSELKEFWEAKKSVLQALNFVFLFMGGMVIAYYALDWASHENQSAFHRLAPTLRWVLPIVYVVCVWSEYRAFRNQKSED